MKNILIALVVVLLWFVSIFLYVVYRESNPIKIDNTKQINCNHDYYIGKGANTFIDKNGYTINDNGCISFNGRISCGKFSIIKKCNYGRNK